MVVRHVAAVRTGLLVSTAIGLLAGLFADDRFWLHVVVFAACTFGPAYGLGWLVFLSRAADPEPVARLEETVEHAWWQRSSAGSFTDLVVVAGLVAGALAVTDLRVDATLLLAGLIALALADVTVRFTVLSRREA